MSEFIAGDTSVFKVSGNVCAEAIDSPRINMDATECPEDVAPTESLDDLLRTELWARRDAVCYKPVIYLYPSSVTNCQVKLTINGKLTCVYPECGANGWCDFTASPDGTLTFSGDHKYYCLFWEGQTNSSWDFSQGYCIKGKDTAAFLSDTLVRMGLTFREANEFIVYWLPRMQNNPYNVIAFQGENYTRCAGLEIEPHPDSVLRIFMAWLPSDHFVDISEPAIESFERRGFTVVEWGGTEVT